MSSIDDRIVQMQFDNAQFEKGVSETNDSLATLKDSLELKGAGSGLDNIQDIANGFSLEGISAGVEQISSAFSVLGVLGINVLSRITQDMISFGQSLISKVLDPLIQGGTKRALALEQAKFQFRGLGLDIEATMAAALGAVKGTAYGLDDAATAAAQFGASGITAGNGLQESLRAIAGVAAQTGSNYSDIARVFTSVAGNGRLMGQDLLSLGSRGVNAAAALSKSMGISEEAVRDLVSEGGIGFQQFSDVMNAAFGENATKANETYSGALANVGAALSRVGASYQTNKFEAHRKVLNAATPVIDNLHNALLPLIGVFNNLTNVSADKIIAFLNGINLDKLNAIVPILIATFDGAVAKLKLIFSTVMPILITAFDSVVKAVMAIIDPLIAAFRQMFPPASIIQIQNFAAAIRDFLTGLILTETQGKQLQSTFAGFFALISIGWQILSKLVGMFIDLLGFAGSSEGGILSFTGTIGDFLVKVDEALKSGDGLNKFFDGLKNVLKVPILVITWVVGLIRDLISNIDILSTNKGIKSFADDVGSRFSGVTEVFNFFATVFEKVKKVFDAIVTIVAPGLTVLGSALSTIGEKIGEALSTLDFDSAINLLNTLLFGGLLLMVKDGMDTLKGAMGLEGVGFVDGIKEVFGQLKDHLKALETGVNAKTLLTIAGAVALLAVSAIALSMVDPIRLGAAMLALTTMLSQLLGAFALIEKIPMTGSKKAVTIAGSMIILAIALDLLAIAVAKLAKLDWNELARGVTGTVVLMGALVAAAYGLSKSGPKAIYGAGAMILMAIAIKLLVDSVTELAGLDWNELARGIVGVTAVMVLLVAMSQKIGNPLKIIPTAYAMVILAGALKILAMAVGDFSKLPMEDLVRGIVGMGLALFVISYAMTAMPKDMIAQAFALVLVAGAVYILAQAFASMAGLSPEEIALGLIAFGGSLLILTVALNAMNGTIPGSIAMVIAAAAMLVLAQAMKVFAGMTWDEIGRGLTVLAGALVLLVAAVILLSVPIFLLGAAALVIAASALMLLAPAMVLLGTMSWEAIGAGLTVMAAAIGILAIGGLLLIPALPGLLGLGAALVLIGTAVLLAAVGVTMFAGALALLAQIGGAAGEMITTSIMAFAEQIPLIATKIGEGVGAFATAISTQGPQITAAIVAVLLSLIQAVVTVVPELISAGVILIKAFVNAIVTMLPFLVDAGLKLVIGLLNGIGRNIAGIVTAATSIVVNFINALSANLPRMLQAGANFIISFINGLADTIRNNKASLERAGLNLADAITGGMSTGIINGVEKVKSAVKRITDAIPAAVKKFLGIASPSKVTTKLGEFTGLGLAVGLNNVAAVVVDAAKGVGTTALTAMQTAMAGISEAVNSDIDIQPSIRPVLDLSAIKKDSSLISGMIGQQSLSLDNVKASATTAAVGYEANQRVSTDADGQPTGAPSTTVSFVQNNNSPKALRTVDIYRQTKNQISSVKEALNA